MEGVGSAAGAGSEAAAGTADCGAADCCEPVSCFAVAEAVVSARAESTKTELTKEVAKNLENAFIKFLLHQLTWRNDADRRLVAECTRRFFGTPTKKNNTLDSISAWAQKVQSIESKMCGWQRTRTHS
jgi:hypothetical protein